MERMRSVSTYRKEHGQGMVRRRQESTVLLPLDPIPPPLTEGMNKPDFHILQDEEGGSSASPHLFLQQLSLLHSIVGWSFSEPFFLFYNLYQRGDTSSEVFLNYFWRQANEPILETSS